MTDILSTTDLQQLKFQFYLFYKILYISQPGHESTMFTLSEQP